MGKIALLLRSGKYKVLILRPVDLISQLRINIQGLEVGIIFKVHLISEIVL